MWDLFGISFLNGVKDGLFPGPVFASALFVILYWKLQAKGIDPALWMMAGLSVNVCLNLIINLGFFYSFIYNAGVLDAIELGLKFIGIGMLAAGAVFFYDWTLLRAGRQPNELVFSRMVLLCGRWSKLKGVIAGGVFLLAVCNALANAYWPMNPAMDTIAAQALLPGQKLKLLPVMAIYSLVSMWWVILVVAVVTLPKMTTTMRLLISAAVCLVSAGTVIYLS